MKTTKIKQSLLAAFLLCGADAVRGGMASGDYTNSLGANVGLWDFSGSYSNNDISDIPLTYSYTIDMDSSGKLSGTGSGTISDDQDQAYFDLTVSINGLVHSSGGAVRVIVSIKLIGTGQVEGVGATFSATVSENLVLYPASRQLTGTARGRATASIPGMGKASEAIPPFSVQASLPEDATGVWGLTLRISPNGTKYTGTGTITLSNSNTFPVVVTGTYNSKSDLSKLMLKGTGPERGISLTLLATAANGELTLQRVNGKALGQTVRLSGGQ